MAGFPLEVPVLPAPRHFAPLPGAKLYARLRPEVRQCSWRVHRLDPGQTN